MSPLKAVLETAMEHRSEALAAIDKEIALHRKKLAKLKERAAGMKK